MNILAKYTVPLKKKTTATIEITGESLSAEDFEELLKFIALFKKAFDGKCSVEPARK